MQKGTISPFTSSWSRLLRLSSWSAAIGSMAILAACGGDSGSNAKNPDPIGELVEPADGADTDLIADTFDDLPVCSSKREGATAYVKDEKTAYICEEGDWTADGTHASSSATTEDLSSSSDKVTEPAEVTSSSSFVYVQSSGAYEQPKVVAVDNKTIGGVSQKGPFVTGSAVKLYELDGKTYAQTGRNFTGKIASDDGKFSVSSVTLASQYALLEANGYFRNEVTGGKSSGTVTLNALTDLSDREKVNINLLTHLEYERALYLVSTGINVPAAKKQAEAEIFNAFGIRGEFDNSEDLDIFSNGEGNAALLAFSVLMLRDLSEADLTELLTKFATDIEKDGSWDDEATKAKIADWAQSWDLTGGLEIIRGNIERWNLGTVPDFEKYVRNFWYANYGLGTCGTENGGEVTATRNELSTTYGTKTRFICKSGAWVEATDFEKDTYLWMDPSNNPDYKDADVRKGDVEESNCYVFENGTWRRGNETDCSLGLRGCTALRQDALEQSQEDYNWYVCNERVWKLKFEVPTSVLEDVSGQSCSSFGKIIHGTKNADNLYFCNWPIWKRFYGNESVQYGRLEDERDNQVYRTVRIGNQTWMAENLNYADSVNYPSLTGKSWCLDDEPGNCYIYGRLYTYAAAIDSLSIYTSTGAECGFKKKCAITEKIQGICPNGWHVPSLADFKELFESIEANGDDYGSGDAYSVAYQHGGKKLTTKNTWLYYDGTTINGTDDYGFSALPYFGTLENGKHSVSLVYINFWASYNYDYAMWMDKDRIGIAEWFGESSGRAYGFPVRCLEDSSN